MIEATAASEVWRLREPFAISRGTKTEAVVVVATLTDGDGRRGRGECVPYARYGETVASVLAAIDGALPAIRDADDLAAARAHLAGALPAGAARNALDCALWDLAAKRAGRRVWQLAGLDAPRPVATLETISLGSDDAMRDGARRRAGAGVLKIKLDAERIVERVRAVRDGAPRARLVIDANEAWSAERLAEVSPQLAALGVELIEQPLPAGADGALRDLPRTIPVCADESCHTSADVERLADRYDFVNVKLDKAGGLSEATALAEAARACGLGVMLGCMVSTSLSIAPALLLAARARFVDVDGPLWLADDRTPGLVFAGGLVHPPDAALWG